MRTTRWLSLLLFLGAILTLGAPARASVFADDNCAENPLIVDDGPAGAKALRVANGYSCPAVDLTITTSLNVNDPNLTIRAASITISTAGDPADPAQRVQIVNNPANSTTQIVAVTGNLTLLGATIKAHKTLRLECDGAAPPPGCKIEADQSDIIVATDFANPQGGGVLLINAFGPIDIQTTNVHGGDALEVQSTNSDITIKCGEGETGCVDPTRAAGTPGGVVEAACGLPPTFPCTVTFQDKAELKGVCIGQAGVKCNGGHKEKRFTATNGTIDIENSRIDSIEHVTFTAKEFKGKNSILTGDSIVIRASGKVDVTDANYTTDFQLQITSGTGCAAGIECITAKGLKAVGAPIIITARNGASIINLCKGTNQATLEVPGAGVPRLNNDGVDPYTINTLDDVGDCGAGNEAIIN
jgi:hypothetical protein